MLCSSFSPGKQHKKIKHCLFREPSTKTIKFVIVECSETKDFINFQMLSCVGGIFLATGSADQVIRVYCFSGVFPEKICELEAHTVCNIYCIFMLTNKFDRLKVGQVYICRYICCDFNVYSCRIKLIVSSMPITVINL